MDELIEQPKYTVIDLPACEAWAYMLIGEGVECPDCMTMPNNPRRSNDGLFGLCTGTGFMFEVSTLTQTEAEELMNTVNWATVGEVV